MQQYILRRIILGAMTAVLVSLVIFVIMRIAPGDVALMIATAGGQEDVTEEMLEAIREELGLNESLPMQYYHWVKGMATLDWGQSLYSRQSIWQSFKNKIAVTFELVTITTTLAIVMGIPFGIIMALKQDTWVDYVVRVISLGGISMPNFWTATLLIVGGIYLLDWNPRLEYVSILKDPYGNLSQFFWPALVLSYSSSATKSRMTRSSMLEVLRQDYIRTARAKGLTYFVVTYRHALKNALLPVVTIIGLTIALTMGGTVIIERIFALPGLGNFLVEGMNYRDYPVVQSVVLFFSMWVVLVNLVVDISYGWLDPRIRYE